MGIELVEPANCTVWQFHQRSGDDASDDSCKDLIASIQRHGQRHAALGRRLQQRSGAAIELIYGGRRLFAATRLGINLLVDIQEVDDRAAIVAMDVENRLRTDISPYERGMSYRRWLNAGLFASQAELARELGVSEPQVSKLLRYAELPAAVVGAFDSVGSIKEEWAVTLAKLCQDPHRRPGLVRRAREFSQAEQRHAPQVVFQRLVSEDNLRGRAPLLAREEVVRNSSGTPIYRVAVRATTIHFILPRESLSEEAVREFKCQLTRLLEQIKRPQKHSRDCFTERMTRSTLSEATNATT